MAGESGILQYAQWGTGATTDTAFGTVTGGEIGPGDSNIQHREGISGQDKKVGGLIAVTGNVEWLLQGTNDATFAGYALRSAMTLPSLTALSIEGGMSNGYGYLHTGCYIDSFSVNGAEGEATTFNATWQGLAVEKVTSPSVAAVSTGDTFEWFQGNVTIDGTNYDVASYDLTVENSLEPKSSLDTKAAGSKRFPEVIKIGSEIVTCNLVLQTASGNDNTLADLGADTLDEDIDVVITCSDGTNTFTITLGNLSCATNPMGFEAPDGLVTWKMALEGTRNAADTITFAYA